MTDKAKELAKTLRGIVANKIHVSWVFEDRRMAEAADLIESLAAELEQVKRERDAAVEDLKKRSECNACAHQRHRSTEDYLKSSCMNCVNFCNWQWRGVKEGN